MRRSAATPARRPPAPGPNGRAHGANLVSASTIARRSSVRNRDAQPWLRRVCSGAGSPRRYLPVRSPLASGKYGQELDPETPALGQDVALGLAMSRLSSFCTLTNCAAPGSHAAARLAQLRGREVRAADFAHLARAHEILERAERVRDRHGRIGLMQLIEIDSVGAQAAQAVVEPRAARSRVARLSARRRFSCRTSSR